MNKSELIVGNIYAEEYDVRMLDGSNEMIHFLHNRRYLGDTQWNFAQLDGSYTHLTDTRIAILTPSRMTAEQFNRALRDNDKIQSAYYAEGCYHGD